MAMYKYTPLEDLTAYPAPAPAPVPARRLQDPLSFVVDLREFGLAEAYRAQEVYHGSQCPVFKLLGPEYVNPWSGAREVAGWIL